MTALRRVAALALVLAIAWVAFSWLWVERLLRARPVTATYSLHVLAVGDNMITLAAGADAGLRGTYGLEWPAGHAVLGRIVRATGDEVVRRLCLLTGARPRRGMTIGFRNNVYWGSPARLGLSFRNVEIGGLPAWLVAARGRTWVIAVHGLGGSRADALQLLPTFHALGLPVLDITYGHSAVSRLGASEWRDLAAAVAYARTHGAANVVVFAYSMGAAIVEELFDHARRAPAVAALIFDSPLLDWKRTVASRVARRDLPAPLLDLALWIASARTGLHFRDVSLERFSRLLTVPTLIVHGTGDTVVPIETSDEFAAMKPRLVDYDRVAGVDHARAWNADPIAYERRLIGFLRRVGVTSARPRPAPPPC